MTNGIAFFRAPDAMNMKAAPGTTFVLNTGGTIGGFAGLIFIPQYAFLRLRAMTGPALTTSPGVRVGTNGTHDNVCPIFIPPTTVVVTQVGSVPLKSPLLAPLIDGNDLILEITQSAVGPTTMTADIIVGGLLLG